MTLRDLKDLYNSRVVDDDAALRGKAAMLASDYPEELSLNQI